MNHGKRYVGKVHKEESKDIRVVIQTKSSLAPKPTPVAYTLEHGFVELDWRMRNYGRRINDRKNRQAAGNENGSGS